MVVVWPVVVEGYVHRIQISKNGKCPFRIYVTRFKTQEKPPLSVDLWQVIFNDSFESLGKCPRDHHIELKGKTGKESNQNAEGLSVLLLGLAARGEFE